MIKKIFQKIIYFLNIALIILSFALAIIAIVKKEWIEAFIQWMEVTVQSLGVWNYLIVLLSSFIEAFPVLGVVVPGQNILLKIGRASCRERVYAPV